MQRRALLALAGLASLGAAAAGSVLTEEWADSARNRVLPVRLRLPQAEGPAPAVVLSHGLGGSREGLGYLGHGLAEAGLVVLHLQHPGTDSALWQGKADVGTALMAAVLDAGQALARLQDGIFALDELLRRAGRPGPLHGRVDPERIAAAGHSYGAWTVQHLIGQRLPGGDHGLRLPDPRLKAAILLSPIPPRGLPPRFSFDRVVAPLLHVTGTQDNGYIDGTRPADREIPFHAISGVPQVLAMLNGATHAAFADEPAAGPRWSNPAYYARTAGLAVAFLRALLLGDAEAAMLLRSGAPGLLAPGDRLELKDFP